MAKKGLLINYGWCSGCQSCEIACRNEHGWDLEQNGIKVLELGPFPVDKDAIPSGIDWSYIAMPTSLCDLCQERAERGEIPTCQLHCLAGVIECGDVDELTKKASEIGKHVHVIIP